MLLTSNEMTRIFVTTSAQPGHINASAKAPNDVVRILEAHGAQRITHPIPPQKEGRWTVFEILRWQLQGLWHMLALLFAALRTRKRGFLLLQYPQRLSRIESLIQKHLYRVLAFLSAKRTIILLHDIVSLRMEWDPSKELAILNGATTLIAHSQKMHDWLVAQGIVRPIEILGAFDYLMDVEMKGAKEYTERFDIAIAGNLSPEKCGHYIFGLKELASDRLEFLLFGNVPDSQCLSSHVRYCGAFAPDTPTVCAHFGLVWDSDCCDCCCGKMGRYLGYNAPHKFSLYLACGIPVIVWNGSAMSKLVQERDIGLTIASLVELPALLASLSRERYEMLAHNARNLGREMRNGTFLHSAMDRISFSLTLSQKVMARQNIPLASKAAIKHQ